VVLSYCASALAMDVVFMVVKVELLAVDKLIVEILDEEVVEGAVE
jgi:hypothetical protein